MTEQLSEFRRQLASGDADQVNTAIDNIEEFSHEERAELFHDAFEMCLDLYEDDDGYQRQSVVRFLRELVPRRRLLKIVDQADSGDELSELLIAADPDALDKVQAFYLAALEDDDGRVRLAAIKGLKNLTVAYRMTGIETRLDGIIRHIDEMIADASGKKLEHLRRARRDAQLGKGSALRDIVSRALEVD